jgi:uncharacterized membrane protein YfcA
VGFGLALVVVPAMTLVSPEALPATVLLLTMPMAPVMAARERHAIYAPGLVYLLSGRLLGTLGGVGLLLLVPDDYLSVLFGSLVVAATLASSSNPKIDLSNRTRVGGRIVSGVMGTAAGIGEPPLALMYQNREGQEIRATLAVAFTMGTVISLLVLALTERVGLDHLLLGPWGAGLGQNRA